MLYYTVSEDAKKRSFIMDLVDNAYFVDGALYTEREAICRIAQYYRDFYPHRFYSKEERIDKAEEVFRMMLRLNIMCAVIIKKSNTFWFFGDRFRNNDGRCSQCPYLRRERGYMFCKDYLNEISEIRTDRCPV